MDKLILQEAADFLRNEIKQYEIAMCGVLRDDYRKYLERKTRYFGAILEIIDMKTQDIEN